MAKIKGWRKAFEGKNALGISERWENINEIDKIYLYGSIGQYGSIEYTLKIQNMKQDQNSSSNDRDMLKRKAIQYMRSHPDG